MEPVKVTVNLPESTVNGLKELANNRGTTVTETLRQLIEGQRYVDSEVKNGNRVLIQNPTDNSVKQLLFNLPNLSNR